MKNALFRCLCMWLVLFMVLGAFVACKKSNSPPSGTTPAISEPSKDPPGNNWETDANGYVKDSIDQTFGEELIKLLIYQSARNDVMPESTTNGKDVISDTVYLRNLRLEERLEVNFKAEYVPGEWGQKTQFMEVAEKSGDYGFDLICTYSLWPSLLATRGLLINLNQLRYPELKMPWWPDDLSEYEQYDALYFVSNNSSIRVIKSMEVCFANSEMIRNYGLESLEESVVNYQWTVDMMIEYAQKVNIDLNVPETQRQYGLVVDEQGRMDAFLYGSGFRMVQKNDQGISELVIALQAAKDKAETLVNKLGVIASTPGFNILVNSATPMVEKRTMFQIAELKYASQLEDAKTYTVLPAPMYDAEQKAYYIMNSNSYDVWCVPTSTKNAERAAVVMEAFASSDYRTLAPAYFDNNLKLRYSNSDIGVQIFDLIRASVVHDFGRISAASINAMESAFRLSFWDSETKTPVFSNGYVTYMDGHAPTYEAQLAELLKAYRKYRGTNS